MWDGGLNPVETVSQQDIPTSEVHEEEINFDRTLPGLHRYLGSDLIEVSGRSFFEPGTETCMYAFYRSGVILVPGQSLPLLPYGPFESNLLLDVHREKFPLIFLPGCFDRVTSMEDLVDFVGTTADLLAIRIPDANEDRTMNAIFIGRQRIRIRRVTRDETYPLVCYGTVLPELSTSRAMASSPLGWGLVPRSWSRFGNDPNILSQKFKKSESASSSYCTGPHRFFPSHKPKKSRRDSENSMSQSVSHFHFPVGNSLAIFDSRLSTWRSYGPVITSTTSSSCAVSSTGHLDHFIDESTSPVSADPCSHASAPELSSPNTQTCDQSNNESQTADESQSSYFSTVETLDNSPSEPSPIVEDVELIMDRAVDRVGRPFRYRFSQLCHPRLLARRDVLAATATCFTSLPSWVYRQYDINYLVVAIQAELLNWNDTWQVGNFTVDLSVHFSYWLVQNLPIPGTLKAELLKIDHVVPRLRSLLDVIQRSAACVCVHCDINITSNRFIICLAQEGSSQTYVNPAGVLHDIVTVSQVSQHSVSLVGSVSEEYSWFPGYSWTITNCSNCSHHLGWLFIATEDTLRPRRFWGMRREAIVPGRLADWHPSL